MELRVWIGNLLSGGNRNEVTRIQQHAYNFQWVKCIREQSEFPKTIQNTIILSMFGHFSRDYGQQKYNLQVAMQNTIIPFSQELVKFSLIML